MTGTIRQTRLLLHVPDMDCPVEQGQVEAAFRESGLVPSMKFNLSDRTVEVVLPGVSADPQPVLSILDAIGFPGEVRSITSHDVPAGVQRKIMLHVPDMDCPVEQGQVEAAFRGSPLVSAMKFNLTDRTVEMTLADGVVDTRPVLATFSAIGLDAEEKKAAAEHGAEDYTIRVDGMDTDEKLRRVLEIVGLDASADIRNSAVQVHAGLDAVLSIIERLSDNGWHSEIVWKKKASGPSPVGVPWMRLAPAFILAAIAEVLELTQVLPEAFVALFSLAAILCAGLGTIRKGVVSLLHFVFNMNTLMAVAVAGAVLLGAWPEAAMVMVLYEIGEAVEQLSLVRARKAIRSLLDASPAAVTARIGGRWVRCPPESLPAGVFYRVEPGERAAMDGVVVEGTGSMDESMITGESLPAAKSPSSEVWAGAVALESSLVIRATAPAADSMSARIIRAVEEAEQKKAPLQRFVDRFAARYTPAVFVIAILTALLGPLVTGGEWTVWVYRALVLLVIACPCALVISTPVTIVSALAQAARRGVLVKGGVYLEEGRRLKHVALDKTGTVTRGEPSFDSVTVTGAGNEKIAWRFAGSLAAMSSHPVSRAISAEFSRLGMQPELVKNFRALPGFGTEGRIDGSLVRLTNLAWLRDHRLATDMVVSAFEASHRGGKTAVALSDFFGVIAVFTVADTLKENALEAISALRRSGLVPHLLTGDNRRAAEEIASEAGISEVRSELTPAEKLKVIEELESDGPTAMAGDGINDAPALSRARIGFAMGLRGADSAIEAADVALMDDDVGKIAWFKKLSELTHDTLVVNISFALAVKILFAMADMMGFATMWMAVFADTGVTMIVVANGMRMMRCGDRVDAMLKNA